MSKEVKLAKSTVVNDARVGGWTGETHVLINLSNGVHIYVPEGHPLENLKKGQSLAFVLETE